MLIRVTVENFKSYGEREQFSMIPSAEGDTAKNPGSHVSEAGGMRLLKYSAVYGANASGKSNLVSVFSFITSTVRTSGSKMHDWSDAYCRNDPENEARDSFFEMQFTVKGKLYAYGFTVVLSLERITSEWLYELLPNGRVRPLFERNGEGTPVLGEGVLFDDDLSDRDRFAIYSSDFMATKGISQLFLSEMNGGKTFDERSKLFFFKQVYDWITKNVIVITPSRGITGNEFLCGEEYMEKLSGLMGSFDTGITKVSEKRISRRDIKGLSAQETDIVLRSLSAVPGRQYVWRHENDVYIIRVNEDRSRDAISTLVLRHWGSETDFYLSDESDGTRRLFDLTDILITDRPDAVYVVDELERSLHPNLTEHFVRTFEENNEGRDTQFIVATHEKALMEKGLFRRDEIWFVEKDKKNTSRLYSLDCYEDTCDDRLADAYSEGRFGAIPNLPLH